MTENRNKLLANSENGQFMKDNWTGKTMKINWVVSTGKWLREYASYCKIRWWRRITHPLPFLREFWLLRGHIVNQNDDILHISRKERQSVIQWWQAGGGWMSVDTRCGGRRLLLCDLQHMLSLARLLLGRSSFALASGAHSLASRVTQITGLGWIFDPTAVSILPSTMLPVTGGRWSKTVWLKWQFWLECRLHYSSSRCLICV